MFLTLSITLDVKKVLQYIKIWDETVAEVLELLMIDSIWLLTGVCVGVSLEFSLYFFVHILEELTLLSVLKVKKFNFWGIKKASKHLTRVLYGLYLPFTLMFSWLSPKLFLNLSLPVPTPFLYYTFMFLFDHVNELIPHTFGHHLFGTYRCLSLCSIFEVWIPFMFSLPNRIRLPTNQRHYTTRINK